mgnify:CR=1 FL=1
MLLAVDIGNTNIVLGVLDGENLVYSGRFSTHIHQTVEECAMNLYSFLNIHSIGKIDGAIISSRYNSRFCQARCRLLQCPNQR